MQAAFSRGTFQRVRRGFCTRLVNNYFEGGLPDGTRMRVGSKSRVKRSYRASCWLTDRLARSFKHSAPSNDGHAGKSKIKRSIVMWHSPFDRRHERPDSSGTPAAARTRTAPSSSDANENALRPISRQLGPSGHLAV